MTGLRIKEYTDMTYMRVDVSSRSEVRIPYFKSMDMLNGEYKIGVKLLHIEPSSRWMMGNRMVFLGLTTDIHGVESGRVATYLNSYKLPYTVLRHLLYQQGDSPIISDFSSNMEYNIVNITESNKDNVYLALFDEYGNKCGMSGTILLQCHFLPSQASSRGREEFPLPQLPA